MLTDEMPNVTGVARRGAATVSRGSPNWNLLNTLTLP